LAEGASGADAVIHAALDADATAPHEVDIEAVGSFLRALAGTGKAFVYTSGLTVLGDTGGTMADEDTPPNPIPFSAWRPALENTVLETAGRQVRSVVIRPGWVYGRGGGAIRLLVEGVRQDGIARPVGNGRNHWPVVHIDDIARCMCWPSSRLLPAPCCTPSGHQQPRSLTLPPRRPGPPEARGVSGRSRWRRLACNWACGPTRSHSTSM
jgi:nucleoside-diphosphate-sugar epimerase